MASKRNPLEQIEKLFTRQKCWTMDQLHHELDYAVVSLRGFLKQMGYFSSFTHNSKWYTLQSIPVFNPIGLWFYENIGFSKHGNFKESILHFINRSQQGLSAKQLTERLKTPCSAVLTQMYQKGRIDRFKPGREFIYLSPMPDQQKRQLAHLPPRLVDDRGEQKLTALSAVYVLVEYIKNPQASFEMLSNAAAQHQVLAPPPAIARFFAEHDLKKTQK
jgi:hypothetical protein